MKHGVRKVVACRFHALFPESHVTNQYAGRSSDLLPCLNAFPKPP